MELLVWLLEVCAAAALFTAFAQLVEVHYERKAFHEYELRRIEAARSRKSIY